MKLFILFIGVCCTALGINDSLQRKRISDDNFDYEFYVSEKQLGSYQKQKAYHYYKSGEIHTAIGGAGGQLLHGDFKKTYSSNGIAEAGEFNNGLKDKSWRTWYEDGQLKEIMQWSNGFKSGTYEQYESDGTLFLIGKYRANKKQGRWISPITKDTLYFNQGKQIDRAALEAEKEAKKTERAKDRKYENFQDFWLDTKQHVKEFFRKKSPEEKERIAKEKERTAKQKAAAKEAKKAAEKARKEKELAARVKALEQRKAALKKKTEASSKKNLPKTTAEKQQQN